jgi:integrase
MREHQGTVEAQAETDAGRREPDSNRTARAVRHDAQQGLIIGTSTANTTPRDSASTLPSGLRERYADILADARGRAKDLAMREMQFVGVVMDRETKRILDEAMRAITTPSDATIVAYQRDHARMRNDDETPLDKASTFQHFNRLRSAYRYAEAMEIASLRQRSEVARKAKDLHAMKAYTEIAYERAVVFQQLFLADERPVWSDKSASLRAQGKRPRSKSKRSAGRTAPTPDQLLVALGNQRGRWARVELFAMCFAVFGIRPAELVRGVVLKATSDGLLAEVCGAKVDAMRGQPSRTLEVQPTRPGQSSLAIGLLREAATSNPTLRATETDIVAVRRAMREVQEGLSPYAYRHARASDIKAQRGKAEVATWLGHASDRTQSAYGNARSSKGTVKVTSATATRSVRSKKSLPPTPAERIARMALRATNAPAIRPDKQRTPLVKRPTHKPG